MSNTQGPLSVDEAEADAAESDVAALVITRPCECWLDFSRARRPFVRCGEDFQDLPQLQSVRGIVIPASDAQADLALLQKARAVLPDKPLIAMLRGPPTPRDYFRLLEARADFIDVSACHSWLPLLESFLSGTTQGVELLHRFCNAHRLSRRERLTLFAACAGLTKVEAHGELGCSPRTLETYWSRIFGKVGIRSAEGILAAALRLTLHAPLHAQDRKGSAQVFVSVVGSRTVPGHFVPWSTQ